MNWQKENSRNKDKYIYSNHFAQAKKKKGELWQSFTDMRKKRLLSWASNREITSWSHLEHDDDASYDLESIEQKLSFA